MIWILEIKKKYNDAFFANDIVLIAPNELKWRLFFHHVFNWTNKNEISFGINKEKCATMVTKALNFANYVLSLDVFYS